MKEKRRMSTLKKILIIASAAILANALILMPIATVVIYESVFGSRFETEEWLRYSASDFEGLLCERSDFYSEDGTRLAGYKYSKDGQEIKGVVVVAHGLGGGGHNFYMPLIDALTSNGYKAFAYDAHGNDESDGESVEGLPQGIIDLNCAIEHARSLEEYAGLPIVLLGHSWGAYSAASVLEMQPSVKAAVIISGFNESEDLLLYESRKYAWIFADISLPYLSLYERLKFGSEYADASALSGIENSDAQVLVIHSEDDVDVPIKYGYGKLYEELGESKRVEFIKYEDRGHSYIFCSEDSRASRDALNEQYSYYVSAADGEYSAEIKQEFMSKYLDKSLCFELDGELVERIIALYDESCVAK